MPEYPWYSLVPAASNLQQGDIILGMNVPSFIAYSYTNAKRAQKIKVHWIEAHWIILTQSCDLLPANQKDLDRVLVCPVANINSYHLSSSNWGNVMGNREPAYHALKGYNEERFFDGEPFVVDFSRAQYADLNIAKEYAQKRTDSERLRLNSPYVENMALRYGFYYSRIGYPVPFPAAEDKAFK